MSWIKLLWVVGTAFAGFYLILVYLLPLIGVGSLPMVPLKGFVEVIICFIPIITGLLLTTRKVRLIDYQKSPSSEPGGQGRGQYIIDSA
jgi:hypothetical protein